MRQVHMCADGYNNEFPLMLSMMTVSTRLIKPCREVGRRFCMNGPGL